MLRILLVDDDDTLAAVLSVWLEAQGYSSSTTDSGLTALAMLNAETFDVVLLDWQLIDIAGIEVLKQMREAGCRTPVIFVTGSTDRRVLDQALDAGAQDVLNKPFNYRQLIERIQFVCQHYA